jgi:hypothetical protein
MKMLTRLAAPVKLFQAGLSPMDATWGIGCDSSGDVLGPATHHRSQGGIEAEALGVVHIVIACQAAVDRLPQQRRQGVLGVLPGPGILQAARCCPCQPEGIIEYPIGEESGVTGDSGAVELQLDLAVEIDSQASFWLSPIGFLARFSRWWLETLGFQGKRANAMPKRPSHLRNPGSRNCRASISARSTNEARARGKGLVRLLHCLGLRAEESPVLVLLRVRPEGSLLVVGKHNLALQEDYVRVEQQIGHSFHKDLPIAEVQRCMGPWPANDRTA